MSIPKSIHYCWFGRNPKPKLAEKCIKSWKKYCPDYKIIEWNEDNYDISSAPLYVRQAYEAKKWAFVTDYIRLQVVYENGGIYLDTDVELKKPLETLLGYRAYFGFENDININTGLGFGAEQGLELLRELMDDYRDIPFVREDGSYDLESCPWRNTRVFLRHGLKQDGSKQLLRNDIMILPITYLSPISYDGSESHFSADTVSVHWFSGSWQTKEQIEAHNRDLKKAKRSQMRVRIGKKLLGEEGYVKLRELIKSILPVGER